MLNQSRLLSPPTEQEIEKIYDLISAGYDLPMLLAYCDQQQSSGLLGAVFSWSMTLKELDDNHEQVWPNYRSNRIRYSR